MSFDSIKHSLETIDSDINELIKKELSRQESGLELIASENYASPAVMQAQGSVLTNKYAEGYPKKRYYDGCEFVDQVEQLAIDRCNQLFHTDFANVQAHSGSSANMACYFSVLKPGDKVLGMSLAEGGHLTHGSPVNFSGKLYEMLHYGLDSKTEMLDYDLINDLAQKEKPKLIIAGASAYSRTIDFEKFASIAQSINATLLVDMAHIAGLVAAGLHPTPVGHADLITSTTHKTLRGPRGGIILGKEEWAKKINSSVFPGMQGGPLEHVIAAKAVAFKEALKPEFKDYQKQVISNSKMMAKTLMEHDIDVVSGGTDNHLILFKTDSVDMSGKEASNLLESVGIHCNKNMIPNDTRSPFVTSGIRIGSPALTTRGFQENESKIVAELIIKRLKKPNCTVTENEVKNEIKNLCKKFPVYK